MYWGCKLSLHTIDTKTLKIVFCFVYSKKCAIRGILLLVPNCRSKASERSAAAARSLEELEELEEELGFSRSLQLGQVWFNLN